MTLSSSQNKRTYVGDGSTTAFSFPYLFYANTDLVVKKDGVVTTAYTVSGAENPSGGTVTMDTAPAADVVLTIERIVDFVQETDFENFDGNPADVTEKAFDLLAMQAQQLNENVSRSILSPIQTTLTSNEISGTIDATTRVLTITTDGPATSLLSSLSTTLDTSFTALSDGDILQYNGTTEMWENAASAGIDITSLTAETTIATGDYFVINDVSEGANNKMTFANVMKGVNVLTDAGAPQTNDKILVYDDSSAEARYLTTQATMGVFQHFTEETSPANDDKIMLQDVSASQTKYVKVSNLPSGALKNNGYASNRFYTMLGFDTGGSAAFAVTANRLYAHPIVIGASETFTRIGIEITTGTAGNARLGIYDIANGVPTSLVSDLGTISTASTGEIELTISQALTPGVYALAIVFSATPTVQEPTMNDRSVLFHYIGGSAIGSSSDTLGFYVSHTYGALPSTFGSVTYSNNIPTICLRKV